MLAIVRNIFKYLNSTIVDYKNDHCIYVRIHFVCGIIFYGTNTRTKRGITVQRNLFENLGNYFQNLIG